VSIARPGVPERAFSGSYTRAVLSYVRDIVGEPALHAVVAAAGETRPLAELLQDATWSSYEQTRALLEACAQFLTAEQFVEAGRRMLELDSFDANLTVQPGDSPNWVFERLDQAVTVNCSILLVSSTQLSEHEWLITQALAAGLEPFEELCALQAGAHSITPMIYGLAPADVVEEHCAAKGATNCVFRLRWHPAEGPIQHVKLLQARVRGLESWLHGFEETVRKVVSSQDLPAVLGATFESLCRAVHSPACVLAVRDLPMPAGGLVFSVGLPTDEAAAIAERLLNGDAVPNNHLVAEVVSARRHYGWIAAVRVSTDFRPEEIRRLELYGRLISATLDSEFAVAEAQRQEHSARALLALATALDQVTAVDEVPEKLIAAVPGVMGLEQVMAVSPAADRSHWCVQATHGFSAEVDRLLRQGTHEMPLRVLSGAMIVGADVLPADIQELIGSEHILVVPFLVGNEWAASILAPIDAARAAAGLSPQDHERLQGLTAQASTAISNAQLLSQIRHQALHDPLTGLPNRALILERADQLLARARGGNRSLAVLFIDLDGFKEVNDTFGHAAGDELLLTFAGRLQAQLRSEDTVGRLGGDEFVVLLEDTSATRPDQVAERLLAAAREPFTIAESGAGRLSVTASIGIATGEREEPGQLLRDADVALYDAKAAGKNRFVVFREQMQVSVHERVLLQMEVQEALRHGELSLLFQTCHQLADGRVVGVLASPRWQHPVRGLLAPHEFGSLLEEGGAVLDLGRWVLTEACGQLARWQELGLDLYVGVTVSSHHLRDESFLPDLEQALNASGIRAGRLVLYIGEQLLHGDGKATAGQLEALHALGVQIAVEGFGAGGFSVTALRDLPIDVLAIDTSFVTGFGDGSAALTRSLIQVAKALGMDTVAEGIASREDQERLLSDGCRFGQGPYFAPPMPADQIEARLTATGSRTGLAAG
jgi:diguanylate cyclase (GGDEF)-like protein